MNMVAEFLPMNMEQVHTEYVMSMDVHENRRIILDFEIFFTKDFYTKMDSIRHFNASNIRVKGGCLA